MTSNTLKLIAVFFMLLDHIGQFIPNMPIWLHWIGRISAPIFIFTMVWGFAYTRDRAVYLKRMYLFGVGMAVLAFLCNNFLKNPYTLIYNNIFVTLLLIGVVVWIREKKSKKFLVGFIGFQILSTIIGIFVQGVIPLKGVSSLISAILPNILFCEGGILIVFLGVLTYFNKTSKKSIILSYGGFCIAFLLLSLPGATMNQLLYGNYQWMMIFALPFMLLYNGQKGRSMKYFFYIFYPAHIFILFLIGAAIN